MIWIFKFKITGNSSIGDKYYCHTNNPDEGRNKEKHNSLIRKFLTKGKSLSDYNENHYIEIMN